MSKQKRIEETQTYDLLCLVSRALNEIANRTYCEDAEDYDDSDFRLHQWASKQSCETLEYLWGMTCFGYENSIGEFLIEEQIDHN